MYAMHMYMYMHLFVYACAYVHAHVYVYVYVFVLIFLGAGDLEMGRDEIIPGSEVHNSGMKWGEVQYVHVPGSSEWLAFQNLDFLNHLDPPRIQNSYHVW